MSDQVQELIAKKNYPRAIEVLLQEIQAKPHNRRMRLHLADLYVMAGRERDAVPVLMTLADQEAKDGFAAKAIAILKRVEKIDPGHREAEDRLAKLIQDKSRRTISVPKPSLPVTSASGMSFGFEEIDPSNEIELGVATPEPEAAPEAAPEASIVPELSLDTLNSLEALTSMEGLGTPEATADLPVAEDVVAEFDASFAVTPEAEQPAPAADLSTPLFDGFSPEELVAVMRGLELVSFEAGDVIVAEGTPGDSMFILTSGKVKAFVNTPKGRAMKVQEFEEGDFFGEIAVLTGKPRTATLTAAVDCDCLELNRETLDEITKTHPGVREVLKKFQKQRAMSTVKAIMSERE